MSGLTARTLEALSAAPALAALDLTNACYWRTDTGLMHLERCSTLTTLNIPELRAPAATVVGLASLGRMAARLLGIRACGQPAVTDAIIAALAQSRTMQELVTTRCYQETITDTVLEDLSPVPRR
jgi:hypothetical protein